MYTEFQSDIFYLFTFQQPVRNEIRASETPSTSRDIGNNVEILESAEADSPIKG